MSLSKISEFPLNNIIQHANLILLHKSSKEFEKFKLYTFILSDGIEYVELSCYNTDIFENYSCNQVISFEQVNSVDNSNGYYNYINKNKCKLEISAVTTHTVNESIPIVKRIVLELKNLKTELTKVKSKRIINITGIVTSVSNVTPNNKYLTKIQLLDNSGEYSIEILIWNQKFEFKQGNEYQFNEIIFEQYDNTCNLIFAQFTTYIEHKMQRPIFISYCHNLSTNLNIVKYSTFESFDQYCDGWVHGRILNITNKTYFCFKVSINIDNRDKIFFFTSFERSSLMPFFHSNYELSKITTAIGTMKKFVLH